MQGAGMGVTAGHDDETTDHPDTLKAAAARISAISGSFTSDEGVEEMLDKSYVPGSVHRSVIVDILHDGIETGQADPSGQSHAFSPGRPEETDVSSRPHACWSRSSCRPNRHRT
jgi:hypothetical protein